MKFDFIIFGGTGQQGRICARDILDSGHSALLVGRDSSKIKNLLRHKRAEFLRVDLHDERQAVNAIKKSGAEVVINCAELTYNVPIMRACLKTGKSVTDLGGLHKVTIEQFKLDREFRKKGIINITGCGSTPGILNVMAAHEVEDFDSIESIYLGFAWDSNIKKFVVPYSLRSIFYELTEPPVVLSNGKFVKEDRIRCKGNFNFKEIGRQNVYCIVHSEVYTFSKYFKNKGLKNVYYMAGFPEHSYDVISRLVDLGFSSNVPIEIKGVDVKPISFTEKVLGKLTWPKGYKEVENLWVKIEGKKDGKAKNSEINCIVKTVPGWEDAGSNVDTGRTISIISQMIFNGVIKEKGVYGPEAVVPHRTFIDELGKRDMHVFVDGKRIN